MSADLTIKWDENQVRNWFGDRGVPFAENTKIRFKTIWHKNTHVIFVSPTPDGYSINGSDEVGMYITDSTCVELFDAFPRKNFSWAKHNLFVICAKNRKYLSRKA